MDLGEIERALTSELRTLAGQLPRALPSAARIASDLVDAAQDEEDRERGHLHSSRLADRVRRIVRALHRIRSGDYGVCGECGEPIGVARLRAIPDTETCLPCQRQRERPGYAAASAFRG